MGAGGLMAACFAFMWCTSMYQMWISRTPHVVLQRDELDKTVIG